MGRSKLEQKNTRKLIKSGKGGSVLVSIPVDMVRNLKWRAKQKVAVEQKGKTIIIRDWKS